MRIANLPLGHKTNGEKWDSGISNVGDGFSGEHSTLHYTIVVGRVGFRAESSDLDACWHPVSGSNFKE